jgi:hypothetical protein
MPGSVTSVFSEPDDFQAALRADGVLSLLITGQGQFRARLTQVTLHNLRLAAGGECLSRIAFIAVPAGALLISLPIEDRLAVIWGGVEMQLGEMVTLGPGQRIHVRTDGPCRWGIVRLPRGILAQYGRAMSGAGFVIRRPRGGDRRVRR